jgi:hypothetical protein
MTRQRSPNYPKVSLQEALDKALVLHDSDPHRHPLAQHVVAGHWEITPSSSLLSTLIATLKQYGLLDTEGSGDTRMVVLTELARQLLDAAAPPDLRRELLKTAALNAKPIRDIWEKFKDGVSRPALTDHLVRLKFSKASASHFAAVALETIHYAGLTILVQDQPEPGALRASRSPAKPRPAVAAGSPGSAERENSGDQTHLHVWRTVLESGNKVEIKVGDRLSPEDFTAITTVLKLWCVTELQPARTER